MKIFYENWGKRIYVAKRIGFAFANHMHDEVEIIYLTEGELGVCCNGENYSLKKGDLVIVFPNLTHSYSHSARVEGYFAIFKSDILEVFGESYSAKIPVCPVIPCRKISPKIEAFFEEALELYPSNIPFKNEQLYALMVLLLAQIFNGITFCENKKLNMNAASQVFAYCNENFSEDISLDSVSRALAVSKYHIIRIFREKLNTTFQAYINRLRMEKAKQLLSQTSESITQISIQTGYNTIRSFNRVFLADTGVSPTQYRKFTGSQK